MKIKSFFLDYNAKKKIYLLATTALASLVYINEAFSQSNNFQGAYGAIGIGLEKNNTKIEQNSSNIPAAGTTLNSTTLNNTFFGFNSDTKEIIGRLASSLKNNDTKPIGEISLGYLFSIEKNFLIGLDTLYTKKNSDKTVQQSYTQSTITNLTGTSSPTGDITNIDGIHSVKINEKENWSLGISPSYAINNDVMIYGRVSYNQLNTQTLVKFSNDSDQDYQLNKKIYGHGVGLGIRYNLQNNLFLNLSGNYIEYNDYSASKSDIPPTSPTGLALDSSTNTLTTTINPKVYHLALSLGYKF